MQIDLDKLLERVPSKYELIVLAAKRARQLVDGAPKLVESRAARSVSVAFEEIAAGQLEFKRASDEQ